MNLMTVSHSEINIMIDRTDLADSTKVQYKKALSNYLSQGHSILDTDALSRYAARLPKSSRSFLKAGIRLWAKHMEKGAMSKADGSVKRMAEIQSSIWQLKAIRNSITVEKSKGHKTHTWLNQSQIKDMLSCCDDSLKGQRDNILLRLMLATGARRSELCSMKYDDIIQQGDGYSIRIVGKGNKERSIRLSQGMVELLEDWRTVTGDGYIVRGLTRTKELNGSISTVAIYKVVNSYGRLIGKAGFAPHDLRRSFAEVLRQAGIPIEQIGILLGHSSIQVTMSYLNIQQNYNIVPADYIL